MLQWKLKIPCAATKTQCGQILNSFKEEGGETTNDSTVWWGRRPRSREQERTAEAGHLRPAGGCVGAAQEQRGTDAVLDKLLLGFQCGKASRLKITGYTHRSQGSGHLVSWDRCFWSGHRGNRGECEQESRLWFPCSGRDGAGSAHLGLAGLNTFSGSGHRSWPWFPGTWPWGDQGGRTVARRRVLACV